MTQYKFKVGDVLQLSPNKDCVFLVVECANCDYKIAILCNYRDIGIGKLVEHARAWVEERARHV